MSKIPNHQEMLLIHRHLKFSSTLNLNLFSFWYVTLVLFLFIFYLNLLGWYWLIRSYRFQVHISTIHDLYIELCTHHSKSNHLPSTAVWYSLLFTTHLPSFPVLTTVVCLCEFLFVFLVYPFVAFSFRTHMSEIVCFLFFLSDLFHLAESTHLVTNGSISSCGWVFHCIIVLHLILSRTQIWSP